MMFILLEVLPLVHTASQNLESFARVIDTMAGQVQARSAVLQHYLLASELDQFHKEIANIISSDFSR